MGKVAKVDWDDYDAPPQPRKEQYARDPHASMAEDCRRFVLTFDEDWLSPKFVASSLKYGTPYVARVMKKMAEEGILSALRLVPMDDEVRVRLGRDPVYPHDSLKAFAHDGKWFVGHYDRSSRDPKKNIFFPGMPNLSRRARVRGRILNRVPTARERVAMLKEYRFEPAKWDGRAHFVLRTGQAYVDACVAIGVEPNTGLPWTCGCGTRRGPQEARCRCGKDRPKYVISADPKACPNCGKVTNDNHWRRHGTKGLLLERWSCMQKIVEQVHGR